MSITYIPISGLTDIFTIKSSDYMPIVKSGSAAASTTYRFTVAEFNNWLAQSGSVLSSSYASASTSASYGLSASYAVFASSASYALKATSASYANFATNASSSLVALLAYLSNVAISSSWASSSLSSSLASTASLANTASFTVSASLAVSASSAVSASRAITASYADNAGNAVSASYAGTASIVVSANGQSGIVFLQDAVFVGAAPATPTNPYISWDQVIIVNANLPQPPFIASSSVVTNTQVFTDSNGARGPYQFFAWDGNAHVGGPANAHHTNIPTTAKNVILEGVFRTVWPDNNTDPPSVIMVRKNTSSNFMCLCGATNADPGNAGETVFNQMICPLDPTDGSFRWVKTLNGPNGGCYGWWIRIVGYTT